MLKLSRRYCLLLLQEVYAEEAKLEASWTKVLHEDNVEFEYYNVMARKAGEGILQVAREKQADIIVMGNRGLGTVTIISLIK